MILVDTGFWLALASHKDRHHRVATATLARMNEVLITTTPVVTETCHMLATRVGHDSLTSFLNAAHAGAFRIAEFDVSQIPRAIELMEKYRNLPMDLADASLVVLAEALDTGRILSTDTRDFGAYRWKNRKPFKNLLRV